MNILFIGDIFGRPGRNTVKKVLKQYREEHAIDLAIANAENMHHGKGVTEGNLEEMREAGVDFFTSGNHVWKERKIVPKLGDRKLRLIRPANYPPGLPGHGWQIVEGAHKQRVLVINLLGRVFMPNDLDCPFRTADNILADNAQEKLSAIIVDFHAETTSEKMAMAHYLDGRVSAVIGTHTHVPTADARVFPKGTAFQTDAGFVGPIDSVIGAEKESIIQHFLTQLPVTHEVASGPTVFNAVKIEIDDKTRKAVSIIHLQQYLD
jgi:2',3'-cyclic-nucleotide 2'-phosphodiesterase